MIFSRFRITLVLLILFHSLAVRSQIRVEAATDTTAENVAGGLSYNLPQTRLIIDVTLIKTSSDKGIFFEFAKDFLNIDNAITRNSVDHKIASIEINTLPETDPDQFYSVTPVRKFPWIRRKTAMIQTTKEGFLVSYNQGSKAGSSLSPGNKEYYTLFQRPSNNARRLPSYHINDALLARKENLPKVDSTIRLPLRKPIYKVETKDLPLIEKARIALEDLSAIRSDRRNLTAGYQEVPYESKTISLMINQLERQEREIVEKFSGIVTEDTLHYRFTYLPKQQDTLPGIVTWLSRQKGILTSPSEEASPIVIKINPVVTPEGVSQATKQGKKPQGLVYRIPTVALCSVFQGTELLYSCQQLINQLGETRVLPKRFKKLVVFPETGGIRSVK